MGTGFNGTVSASGATDRNARYGSGINLNYRSRRAILSFSYRFGNQNLVRKERKMGSKDIQDRIKGGG